MDFADENVDARGRTPRFQLNARKDWDWNNLHRWNPVQNQWEPDTACNRIESHNPTRWLASRRIVWIPVKNFGPDEQFSGAFHGKRPTAVAASIRSTAPGDNTAFPLLFSDRNRL